MKFCNQCGATLEDDMKFCLSCGAKQEPLIAVPEVAAAVSAAEAAEEAVNEAAEAVTETAENAVEEVKAAEETAVQEAAAAEEVIAPVVAEAAAAADNAAAVVPDAAPVVPEFSQTPSQQPYEPYQAPAAPSNPPKKSKKGLIIGIAAAAVAVIGIVVAVLVILGLRKETIDASKLVKVIGFGPDGHGQIAVLVANEKTMNSVVNSPEEEYPGLWSYLYDMTEDDEETYPEGIRSYLKMNSSEYFSGTKAWKTLSNEDKIDEAKDALKKLKFTVEDEEKNGSYSVGDTIKITVKYDEDDLKKAHVKLTNTTFEYTFVEGDFAKCTKVVPFEKLVCTFEGYDGSAEIKYSFDDISEEIRNLFYLHVDTDYYDAKKNGDTITFVADPYGDLSKGYLIRDGKYYTVDEKDLKKVVTVSGLKELEVLDLFAGIKFSYDGYAPSLTMKADTSGMPQVVQDNVEYRLSRTSGLNIGDTVTVTARIYYSNEKALKEAGYTYDEEKMTMEYTIPANAPHIVTGAEEGLSYDPESVFALKNSFEQAIGSTTLPGGTVDVGGEITAVNDIRYKTAALFVRNDEYGQTRNELWQIAEIDYTVRTAEGDSLKTLYFIIRAYDVYTNETNALYSPGGVHQANMYSDAQAAVNDLETKKAAEQPAKILID